jgi:peptidoglycan/xylan/chitin deacetylase (PgdA/CDA1 family)
MTSIIVPAQARASVDPMAHEPGFSGPAAAAITLHVPVLLYHNVLPRDQWPAGTTDDQGMYITPERVYAQLKYLRDHGWRPVTARGVAQYVKRGERMHSKAFVISVDDGRRNAYRYLWPILRQLKFRATFYVVGARIGKDKFMSADQLREINAAGSEIANHTYEHLNLTRLSRAAVIEQVRRGSDAIVEAVGRRPITLAYPGGRYNSAVIDAVRAEGSTWMAFTVRYGCSESWSTRFHEERMIMRQMYTPANVLALLAPYVAG